MRDPDNPEVHDELAVDRSPFGGAADIPAETWGDPQAFDAGEAADLLGEVTSALEAEDNRTPHQKAVDLAWRAERIEVLLQERGDYAKADLAAQTIVNILMLLDPTDSEGAEAAAAILSGLIDECDGYDSGVRYFEQPPQTKSDVE